MGFKSQSQSSFSSFPALLGFWVGESIPLSLRAAITDLETTSPARMVWVSNLFLFGSGFRISDVILIGMGCIAAVDGTEFSSRF